MFATLFVKKLIFFLSTGTILFYLISFSSVGQVLEESQEKKAMFDCQQNVKVMNYSPLRNLRRNFEVTHKNILKLTIAEQRAVSRFLKESQNSLVKYGNPNPVMITTHHYEAKNRRTLGFKIAVYSPEDKSKIATYFVGTEGNILFTHWTGVVATKKWNCEPIQYLQ